MYITKITSSAATQINSVAFALSGSFVTADNSAIVITWDSQPNLDSGADTTINNFGVAGPGTFTKSSGIGTAGLIPSGVHYIMVYAQITPGATSGHTLQSTKITFTTTQAISSDTQSATGGTKTIS